jgi:hypothetical protein
LLLEVFDGLADLLLCLERALLPVLRSAATRAFFSELFGFNPRVFAGGE